MKLRKFDPKSATANERERNRVAIIVAVIGAISVILAAIISTIPDLLQESSASTALAPSPTIATSSSPEPTLTLNEFSVLPSPSETISSFSGVCYYHNLDNHISLSTALKKFSLLYKASATYYYCIEMKGLGCTGKVFLQNSNDTLPPDTWLAILEIKNKTDCDLGGGIILPY